MADDKDSLMFSDTDQLFPNKSTGTKPRIDSFNFNGMHENTLRLREYKGQYGGGDLVALGGLFGVLFLHP